MDFVDKTLADFAEDDLKELWDTDYYAEAVKAAGVLSWPSKEALKAAGDLDWSSVLECSTGGTGVVLNDRLMTEASLGVISQLSTLGSLSTLLAAHQDAAAASSSSSSSASSSSSSSTSSTTSLSSSPPVLSPLSALTVSSLPPIKTEHSYSLSSSAHTTRPTSPLSDLESECFPAIPITEAEGSTTIHNTISPSTTGKGGSKYTNKGSKTASSPSPIFLRDRPKLDSLDDVFNSSFTSIISPPKLEPYDPSSPEPASPSPSPSTSPASTPSPSTSSGPSCSSSGPSTSSSQSNVTPNSLASSVLTMSSLKEFASGCSNWGSRSGTNGGGGGGGSGGGGAGSRSGALVVTQRMGGNNNAFPTNPSKVVLNNLKLSESQSFYMPPTPPSCSSSDSESGGQSPARTPPLYEALTPQFANPRKATRILVSSRNPINTPLISSQPKGATGTLHLTEEEKRTLISEGYQVPSRLPLTKAEEKSLKKIRRKIKNKISAQESRRKKKEYMDALERKVEDLVSENGDYKRRLDTLKNTNSQLLAELRRLQSQITQDEKNRTRSTLLASTLAA